MSVRMLLTSLYVNKDKIELNCVGEWSTTLVFRKEVEGIASFFTESGISPRSLDFVCDRLFDFEVGWETVPAEIAESYRKNALSDADLILSKYGLAYVSEEANHYR